MKKTILQFAAASITALTLVACGGGDDATPAGGPPIIVNADGTTNFEGTALASSLSALPLEALSEAEKASLAYMREEEKRKVRIAAGGLQSIWRLRPLLNPFRYGTFCFQYISHRVLRWSLTPILLFLLLPLNTILIFTTSTPLLYAIIWLLQALFYLMGSWGYYLSMKHIKNKILFIPYYFLFMNVNVIRGFNYLHKRTGNASGAWEKARRA